MKCKITWAGEGVSFIAETGSNHRLMMDGAAEFGGKNLGARPMELLLAGTGGCTAFDVLSILKKGRHDITDCTVDISADRALEDPKIFTRIHFGFRVTGRGLRAAVVERAISLSKDKYCSASIMLGKTAAITHDVEIINL